MGEQRYKELTVRFPCIEDHLLLKLDPLVVAMELCDQKVVIKVTKSYGSYWKNHNSIYHYYYPWYFHFSEDVTCLLRMDFDQKRIRLDFSFGKMEKQVRNKVSEYIKKRHGFMKLDDIDLKYNYRNCQRIVAILTDLACYNFHSKEETVGAK